MNTRLPVYQHGNPSAGASAVAYFESLVERHPKLFGRGGMAPEQKRQQQLERGRPVTRAEVREMQRLRAEGLTLPQVAKRVGRAVVTCQAWLARARRGQSPKEGGR